jgi:hypothetical protein
MTETLKTFPANKTQAIALAWLNQQDLSNLTPVEAASLFNKAEKEIWDAREIPTAHVVKTRF